MGWETYLVTSLSEFAYSGYSIALTVLCSVLANKGRAAQGLGIVTRQLTFPLAANSRDVNE